MRPNVQHAAYLNHRWKKKQLELRLELRTNRFAICCATTAPHQLVYEQYVLYLYLNLLASKVMAAICCV